MTNDLAGHVTALLDLYRTGELDPPVRERVAAHLAGCETCARDLSSLEAFSGVVSRGLAASRALRGDAAPDAAGARRRGVISRIAEADRRGARWFPAGLPRWAPQALAAAVGAIALGVLLRQGVWPPGRETPADSDRPAVVATVPSEAGERTAADGFGDEADAETMQKESDASGRAGGALREHSDEISVDAAAPRNAAPGLAAEAREGVEQRAGEDRLAAPPEAREEAPPEPLAEDSALERADEVAAGGGRSPGERLLADFVRRAHAALAVRDGAAADEALDLWSDSLAGRSDVAPRRMEAAETLADSLADLVASAGEGPGRE